MAIRLFVIHQTKPCQSAPLQPGDLRWATCLREITFTIHQPSSATEFYSDQSAYQFLLQIICGLKSSLLGETEVMGQFKLFMEQVGLENPFGKFIHHLWVDAKAVRNQYLKNFGSQSYASLARRWCKGQNAVHVIGGGHLAQEINPWMMKSVETLTSHVRSTEKAKEVLKGQVVSLSEPNQKLGGALIIAAPLSNQELLDWIARNDCQFKTVIDFREGENQSLINGVEFYCLKDAFSQVDQGLKKRLKLARQAKRAIDQAAEVRFSRRLIRPFGWDDLCA